MEPNSRVNDREAQLREAVSINDSCSKRKQTIADKVKICFFCQFMTQQV